MHTYTVRDLREKTGAIIHGAEAGQLSIVTKHGRPVFVAVPLNETLLEHGIPMALAIELFKEGGLTLAKAAKFAGVCIEDFMERLSAMQIPVVDYPPEELDEELKNLG